MKRYEEKKIKKMNTEKMEISGNEMETAAGGGVSEFFQAMKMAWDVHNCENNSHDFVWKGELEKPI